MQDIETIPVNLPHFKTLKYLETKLKIWREKAEKFIFNREGKA